MRSAEFSLSMPTFVELLKATLDKKAMFKFQAKGFSMSPFIKDGDVVTISGLNNSAIDFGKPVAFINPYTGGFAIHRVVGKRRNGCLIKGDSTFRVDGLIPKENILGIVTKVERGGRNIVLGLGPERFIIASLSQGRILYLLFWIWRLIPVSVRRYVKRFM